MTRILQGEVRAAVERLCREGEAHADAGEHAEALACFLEAWELLPEPRESYGATAGVVGGLTRVLRAGGAPGGGLELLLGGRSHLAPLLAALGRRTGDD